MSDFDSSATGTGFQMFAGGFSVIPNFDTALWKFKFDLDMPGQYFNETNVLYNWATFQDTAQTFDKITVACAVKIGDPDSARVMQYNKDFDATVGTDLPYYQTNSDKLEEDATFERNWY